MQGRKDFTPRLFYQLSLDRLVPADNFYRQIARELDFSFLYAATSRFYGSEGNPGIDPMVSFKVLPVGCLNNISSGRALMRYCSNCLDVRLFLGFDLDEYLPWHTTISRTRQLYGEEVCLDLFRKVLEFLSCKGLM